MTTDIRALAPRMPNAFAPTATVATGGQPAASDLEALARAGYRTVVDLRAPGEPRGYDEAAVARQAGMAYVSIPVGHAPLTDATFDAFRAVLRDADRQPVLVHCASGNRVGLLLIPHLVLDAGKTPQEAVDLAVRAGLRSPQLAQIALDHVTRHDASRRDRGEAA